MDLDTAHFNLTTGDPTPVDFANTSPGQRHFQRSMKANLFGEHADRILPIRSTPEQEHVGFARERNALKTLPLSAFLLLWYSFACCQLSAVLWGLFVTWTPRSTLRGQIQPTLRELADTLT